MTEGEELTHHKSNTVDRALRVHPLVTCFVLPLSFQAVVSVH